MIYDIIGIGIGPFNLGLAALASDIPNLNCIFFDGQPSFNWHPGLLIPGARLQVPFYADLVTLVQPQSRFSWFSFLRAKQRLFRFGVQDNPFPLRREYNEYGQWVAGQLESLHFGHRCTAVHYDELAKTYIVTLLDSKTGQAKMFHAKHLVIGIGSEPHWPAFFRPIQHPRIFHASEYLFKKDALATARRLTIVGSGQSSAEVFQESLKSSCSISWFTRSPRFFPMETTPAAFEHSSPDYRDHFYNLPPAMKAFLLAGQDALYKGINAGLLSSIYEQLYERGLSNPADETALHTNCELLQVVVDSSLRTPGEICCSFQHRATGEQFLHRTDALILATGYQERRPDFLEPVTPYLTYLPFGQFDVSKHYSITVDDTIFVQNAETHSHGFASSDLSFGPYRNAVILNSIVGYEHFTLEKHIAFQTFGVPDRG
jgi:lysine N6-hydroxylase